MSGAGTGSTGAGNGAETGFVAGIDYPSPFDDFALRLAGSARRYLCLLSPRLDARVFDTPDLVSALTALARRSRQTDIRILVQDARPLVKQGHRLLQLARRMPSKVRLQVLPEHPEWPGHTLVIRDRDGVLYLPADSESGGFFEPDSRASTQKHLELFESLWRSSAASPELRRLHL